MSADKEYSQSEAQTFRRNMVEPIVLARKNQQISVKVAESQVYQVMFVENIILIEKISHTNYVNIVYVNNSDEVQEVKVRAKIGDFCEIMPDNFPMVDRSLMVNVRFVDFYADYVLKLSYKKWKKEIFKCTSIANHLIELEF